MENRPRNEGERDRKRAQFTEPQRRGIPTWILVVALVALVGVGGYLVFSSTSDTPAAAPVQPAAGGAIRIPLADLASGEAKFYDHTLPDRTRVRFFAVKSSDGVYRAALDACDVCFHAKKGYKQDGDDMVCNNCGLKFQTAMINEVQGGCNPVGLPRTIEGDQLVIQTAELERRGNYFK